jgi:hypothetical protein
MEARSAAIRERHSRILHESHADGRFRIPQELHAGF